MRKIKDLGYVVGFIMMIDVLGFIAWAFSGQFPVDNFFVGGITRYLLTIIF